MRSRHGGFTLVEVLLAFLILMLGIIGVLSLFPVGMKLSQNMVETSTAALVARNVRGCMEATNLADAITPKNSDGIPVMDPRKFPAYFPNDFDSGVVTAFLQAISNNTVQPPINSAIVNGKVLDTANPNYSWDARFTLGQGAFRMPPWSYGDPNGWSESDVQGWFSKYFRYYVVQISVYRGQRGKGYTDIDLGSGSISGVVADMEEGPANPDLNLIPTCRLVLNGTPSADLEVGWYIRVPNEKSDWYQIKDIDPDGRTLTLDRPYAGSSGGKSGIIATGGLVGHYTTFLAAYNE